MADKGSKAEAFDLTTSPSPKTSTSHDPRVSLRPSPPALPADPPPPPLAYADPVHFESEPQTLSAFRANEGDAKRLERLRDLFDSIPVPHHHPSTSTLDSRGDEAGQEDLRTQYAQELYKKCSGCQPSSTAVLDTKAETAVRWTEFEKYAEEKEKELWRLFVELDVDGDMRLRQGEVREACKRAGVVLKDGELNQFIDAVGGDGEISFEAWRDTFLVRSIVSALRYRAHTFLPVATTSSNLDDGDLPLLAYSSRKSSLHVPTHSRWRWSVQHSLSTALQPLTT